MGARWGDARMGIHVETSYAKCIERKELAMNGLEIIILLFTVRLLIPLAALLSLGEWVRRRDANYWLKM